SKKGVSPFFSTPWLRGPVRHQLNQVPSLKRRYCKSPSLSLKSKLARCETVFSESFRDAKLQFEENLVRDHGHNQNDIYQYIRSLSKTRAIPETLCFGSECTSDDHTKATLFNKYFFSVFTSNTSVVPPVSDRGPIPSEYIDSVVCSEEEVYEILSSLNSTKAMGIDKINSNFLKKCALPLTPPLTILFNLSLSSGSIPLEWRSHLVKPIYKSGDSTSGYNYRPIALLPIVSKVLERIVYNRLIALVGVNLSPMQFGFLPQRSTVQQMLTMLSVIFTALD
uniref:Uncharacterized protein n=1 Tax=Amphimedon queenslandica TaxID=400682 RepID=A0A1X7SGD0_AMPQE